MDIHDYKTAQKAGKGMWIVIFTTVLLGWDVLRL